MRHIRFIHIRNFLVYLLKRLLDDRIMNTAGALSFTTVLSLVPLVAVMLYALSGFPVFHTLTGRLHQFLFSNFIPATGAEVQKYLERFATNAANMTTVGVVFLFVTAIILMQTIDQTLNAIWRVQVRRSLMGSFIVYWAILTIGPLLVGLSLLTTSYLVSLPVIKGAVGHSGIAAALGVLPFLFNVIAFLLTYRLVPNSSVRTRHAMYGAVTAAVLFEGAKHGFAFYIAQFPSYTIIYGALAAIPIFLVWVYMSWLIALLGAEVTYCSANFQEDERVKDWDIAGLELIAAYRIVGHLAEAQRDGRSLAVGDILQRECEMVEAHVIDILAHLHRARLVLRTDDDRWSLARDASSLTLGDLYRAVPSGIPVHMGPWGDDRPWNRAFAGVLAQAHEALHQSLDVQLTALYRTGTPGGDRPGGDGTAGEDTGDGGGQRADQ